MEGERRENIEGLTQTDVKLLDKHEQLGIVSSPALNKVEEMKLSFKCLA